MVASKTDLLKILNNTKSLVRLVSLGDNVASFTVKLGEQYGFDLTEKEIDQFCKKYLGKSYSGLLNYLKRFSKVDNGSEERPNPGASKYRRFGNPPACRNNQKRTVNYGRVNRII